MNKRSQSSSSGEETHEPESQSDPNPRWSELEAQVAERSAEAVAAAKRGDSDVRRANAHLGHEEVT